MVAWRPLPCYRLQSHVVIYMAPFPQTEDEMLLHSLKFPLSLLLPEHFRCERVIFSVPTRLNEGAAVFDQMEQRPFGVAVLLYDTSHTANTQRYV